MENVECALRQWDEALLVERRRCRLQADQSPRHHRQRVSNEWNERFVYHQHRPQATKKAIPRCYPPVTSTAAAAAGAQPDRWLFFDAVCWNVFLLPAEWYCFQQVHLQFLLICIYTIQSVAVLMTNPVRCWSYNESIVSMQPNWINRVIQVRIKYQSRLIWTACDLIEGS